MSVEKVMEIALQIAKDKEEWVDENGEHSLIAEKPVLFHYTRLHKLVWSVYFCHYFTEEEKQDADWVTSITLAVVKIDDATGEVIFADWMKRPHINNSYQ